MRNRKTFQTGLFLTACTFLTMLTGMKMWQNRSAEQTAVFGRYSRAEVAALSLPICQVMLPGSTQVETSIYKTTTFTVNGEEIRHWDVDTIDTRTGDSAHILWNADTGEMMRASRLTNSDHGISENATSTQTAALGLAWDWFHALSIRKPNEAWKIVATRKKTCGQWEVYARAGDRYTMMVINTVSGQLVQAVCGHLPDAKTAWNPIKNKPLT